MNPELLRYLQGLYTGGGLEPAAPEALEPELVDPQGPMRPEAAMSGVYDPRQDIDIDPFEKQMRDVQRARELEQSALEAETEQLIAQGAAQPLRKLSMPEVAPPEQMGRRLPLSASPLPASPSAPAVAAAGALAPTQPEAPLPGIQQLLAGDIQPRRSRGYLESLEEAQRQDDAAAAFRRLGMAGQGIAQALSQGLYRPMDLGAGPSAVAQLQQRQAAVADYLQRQRQEQEDAARLRYMGAQTKAYEALATQREREPVPKPVAEPRESLVAAEEALAEQRKAAAELARKQAEQVGKPRPVVGARDAANKAGKEKPPPATLGGLSPDEQKERAYEVPGFQHDVDEQGKWKVLPDLKKEVPALREASAFASKLTSNIDRIMEIVDKFGAETLPSGVRGELEALITQTQLDYKGKDGVDLGVLTGNDKAILEELIPPETKVTEVISQLYSGQRDRRRAQYATLRRQVAGNVARRAASYGYVPRADSPTQRAPGGPVQTPTGGAMKLPPAPPGMVYVQMAKDGSVRPVTPEAARALIQAQRAKEVAP